MKKDNTYTGPAKNGKILVYQNPAHMAALHTGEIPLNLGRESGGPLGFQIVAGGFLL